MAEQTESEGDDLRVLQVVVGTPKSRMGGVRAGLLLGEYLSEYVSVDTVKMRGDHDETLVNELELDTGPHYIPTNTALRDVAKKLIGSDQNYSNALIWTRLNPPRELETYDVVHIHNAVPLGGMVRIALSCRICGVPYCVTTHGISKIPELPDQMEMPAPARLAFKIGFLRPYWWVLRNAAHLFALSEIDADVIREKLPESSVSISPNGVKPNPPEEDVSDVVESEAGISDDLPLLLFVGKLLPSKGIGDLLVAFDQLESEARLAVVGPIEHERFADRIEEIDGAEHLGYVEQSLLDSLYQRADLFVFPTRSDVFPLVTLEAMAAGTPIITTNVGGLPEQITDETGVLVEPQRPDELVLEIKALLADEERRHSMGTNAIARVRERFSWDSIAKKTAEQYDRILSSQTEKEL